MTRLGTIPDDFDSDQSRRMVDAIRGCLGLAPLYSGGMETLRHRQLALAYPRSFWRMCEERKRDETVSSARL